MDGQNCRTYLDQWDSLAFAHPREGYRHAQRGLERVRQLGNPPALQARALTIHGSACRSVGDLAAAERSYARAQGIYDQLGGDRRELALDEADLWRRVSYLRTQQQRFAEALELGNRAIRVYSAAGEKHELGRALVAKALVERHQNDPATIATLGRALAHLDATRNPNAHFGAVYNLVFALCHFQAPPEVLETALAYLTESRLSKESRRPSRSSKHTRQRLGRARATVPDAMTRLLQGRIYILLEQHEEARPLLESARLDLHALGMPFDAAAAALELAECYLRMHEPPRWGRIEKLAQEALALFSAVPDAAEVIGAWRLFQSAIRARSCEKARHQLQTARQRSAERNRR